MWIPKLCYFITWYMKPWDFRWRVCIFDDVGIGVILPWNVFLGFFYKICLSLWKGSVSYCWTDHTIMISLFFFKLLPVNLFWKINSVYEMIENVQKFSSVNPFIRYWKFVLLSSICFIRRCVRFCRMKPWKLHYAVSCSLLGF